MYGQPIRHYTPYYAPEDNEFDENGRRKLERMTDEDYVSYVRSKMWEKSHGYVLEERARREEQKKQRKEKEERERVWNRQVEEALRRGEERRRKNRWKGAWEGYLRGWEQVGAEGKRGPIVWPVESGRGGDVDKEQVERFYKHAPRAADGGVGLVDVLKKERVRWHPDKLQQRAGAGGLDVETMKLVTAVFQTVDALWNDLKGKA